MTDDAQHRDDPFTALQLRDHPLRAPLSQEMHVRTMPRLSAPARLLQFVLLVDEDEARESSGALAALLAAHGVTADTGDRFLTCRLGMLEFSCERHTEFMTYSFIADGDGDPFDLTPFAATAQWIAGLPGRIIRSTQIALVRTPPSDAMIASHFATDDLIISDVAQGRARIWSDFRLHANGFGRLLIRDNGLAGAEPSQLIQRLQELGNYRKMALLGLPEAQRATPVVTALEQRLTNITARVAEKDADADSVLAQLSALSAELAQIVAHTRYRMIARRFYRTAAAPGDAYLRRLHPAAGGPVATHRLDQRHASYARRHRAGAAQSRFAGVDGPAHWPATALAAYGRGTVGRRDQLLCAGPVASS